MGDEPRRMGAIRKTIEGEKLLMPRDAAYLLERHDRAWLLLENTHLHLELADAVVRAVKQRRTDALLRQGDGAANERAIAAALANYDEAHNRPDEGAAGR